MTVVDEPFPLRGYGFFFQWFYNQILLLPETEKSLCFLRCSEGESALVESIGNLLVLQISGTGFGTHELNARVRVGVCNKSLTKENNLVLLVS